MGLGIKPVDVHGLNLYQAKVKIDSELRRAGKDTYRLRIIHGYNSGTDIKEALTEYGSHPKVKGVTQGSNPGETLFILRDM